MIFLEERSISQGDVSKISNNVNKCVSLDFNEVSDNHEHEEESMSSIQGHNRNAVITNHASSDDDSEPINQNLQEKAIQKRKAIPVLEPVRRSERLKSKQITNQTEECSVMFNSQYNFPNTSSFNSQ